IRPPPSASDLRTTHVSLLDETRNTVRVAAGAIDTAATAAGEAVTHAQEKQAQANHLGIYGVAATVQAATDCVEAAALGIAAAKDAADQATNRLGEIADETRTSDSSDRAKAAISDLDKAATDLAAASGSAETAAAYAEETDVDSLITIVSAMVGEFGTALSLIGDAKTTVETYQVDLEALSTGKL
ncbi:MAG: hypothetical protein ACRDUA_00250, partial [Micromonosporaceae bacterium]